jgi:hypothetical protein
MDFLASLAIVALSAVVALFGGGIGIVGALAKRPGLRWGVLAVGASLLVLVYVLAAGRADGQPRFVFGSRYGGSDELADSEAPLTGLWVRSLLFAIAGPMVAAWALGTLARARQR